MLVITTTEVDVTWVVSVTVDALSMLEGAGQPDGASGVSLLKWQRPNSGWQPSPQYAKPLPQKECSEQHWPALQPRHVFSPPQVPSSVRRSVGNGAASLVVVPAASRPSTDRAYQARLQIMVTARIDERAIAVEPEQIHPPARSVDWFRTGRALIVAWPAHQPQRGARVPGHMSGTVPRGGTRTAPSAAGPGAI